MNSKYFFIVIVVSVFIFIPIYAQQNKIPGLKSRYLGQKLPDKTAELFAPDIVSVKQGVHGNIVFSPDFKEAAWSPNYTVSDKNVIFLMAFSDGHWGAPEAVVFREGCSQGEPFYSYSGRRFYFLSGQLDAFQKTEKETIWYIEQTTSGWSDARLLTPVLDSFSMHWQFSLDKDENLYFGGNSSSDQSSEIYFSRFENGQYLPPVKLPENINTDTGEFAPCISPDHDYLIFTRAVRQEGAPPQMNLFISFRDKDGMWQKAENLTEKIGLPEETRFIMMNHARITPDGKYLFFTFFNGKGHMVYWMDANIIK